MTLSSSALLALLEFVGAFLAAGAIGFRYFVLRRMAAPGGPGDPEVYDEAARRAALLGLSGVVLGLVHVGTGLSGMAARLHTTVPGLITGSFVPAAWVGLTLLSLAGFAVALAGKPVGWAMAAVGVIVGALREGLVGNWIRLINPMHLLAGGFWIGTLFVLTVAGVGPIIARRGGDGRTIAVDMINAFSPLALGSAAVLLVFGVTTAWRHLKRLDALVTTPYGWTLVAKLCLVGAVAALGAWNWRRQRPRLGTEAGVDSLRRSARTELLVAGLVLIVTAVLVSLPSPQ